MFASWENNVVGADDNGSVHGDHGLPQPWDEDEAFEDGSASTKSSEYQHSYEWDQKPKVNAKHRTSETFRGDKDRFNKGRFDKNDHVKNSFYPQPHHAPKFGRPEPAQPFFNNAQQGPCKNKICQVAQMELMDCRRDLEDRNKRIETLLDDHEKEIKEIDEENENEAHEMRIQLFHSEKKAKEYEEVEKLYQAVVVEKELEGSDDPEILEVKQCYAEALFEQENFEDAEKICKAVWDKKKKSSDPLSEDTKQCHQQLCAIFFARKNFKQAVKMHRKMWDKEPKDEWALNNGDEVCQKLAAEEKYQDAMLEQGRVWKDRHKFNGPRDELTIRSGLREIAFGDKIIEGIDGSADEEEARVHAKKHTEVQIKVALKRLWAEHERPEKVDDFLNIGLRLGDIYLAEKNFADAEIVLDDVWAGRKLDPGENDLSTISIGSKVGKALMGQEGLAKYQRAAAIFQAMWEAKLSQLRKSDDQTISSAEDLSSALWLLQDWPGCEKIDQWILDRKKKKLSDTAPEAIDVRIRLAQALIQQGRPKHDQATALLKELYPQLKTIDPASKASLHFGYVLADMLYNQKAASTPAEPTEEEIAVLKAKTEEILEVIQDVFGHREAEEEKDNYYVLSGRLCGELLLEAKNLPEAERVLGAVWAHPVGAPEEQSMHLNCGHLYAHSMMRDPEHPQEKEGLEKAKDVFKDVLEAQKGLFPPNSPEIIDTKGLLKECRERLAEIDGRPKPPPKPVRGHKRGLFSRG